MKKLAVPLLLLSLLAGYQYLQEGGGQVLTEHATEQLAPTDDSNWRSGSQVRGSGVVERVLSDDNDGSRHQRFILRVTPQRSVLIAHNIDLAPRVRALSVGDVVSFYGQFESNDRGGVIHWTHHDPQGRHADGWLQHDGQRYE